MHVPTFNAETTPDEIIEVMNEWFDDDYAGAEAAGEIFRQIKAWLEMTQ